MLSEKRRRLINDFFSMFSRERDAPVNGRCQLEGKGKGEEREEKRRVAHGVVAWLSGRIFFGACFGNCRCRMSMNSKGEKGRKERRKKRCVQRGV